MVDKQKNINTRRCILDHIKLFKNFLLSAFESREPKNIEAKKLDKYNAQFILCVRKLPTKENFSTDDCDIQYKPNTFTALH